MTLTRHAFFLLLPKLAAATWLTNFEITRTTTGQPVASRSGTILNTVQGEMARDAPGTLRQLSELEFDYLEPSPMHDVLRAIGPEQLPVPVRLMGIEVWNFYKTRSPRSRLYVSSVLRQQ